MEIQQGEPLAPRCTLGLGGVARFFAEVDSPDELADALAWAARQGRDVLALGGGSNLVIADQGVDALVVRSVARDLQVERCGEQVVVTAGAGLEWDTLVATCAGEGWQGIECLSGIPGTVGATPIQNVGAYGQEVAETVRSVHVLSLADGRAREMLAAECGFGYRTSIFRRQPGRLLVLAVRFELRAGGSPSVRYPELARAVGLRASSPSLATVREAVLELRRAKSMVVDADDPCSRSVGSFFVNPVLDEAGASRLVEGLLAGGVIEEASELPSFPADGAIKLSAGWLIEHAGFPRGTRRGAVGVSPRHALALVHHGGGTAAELVALAREIRARVRACFGVDLQPEPVFWGFSTPDPTAARQ